MKTTVNLNDFRDAFQKMGRGDDFSLEGLKALFDYFVEQEQATGEEMELDVIAICCDYTEYDNLEAMIREHDDLKTLEDFEEATEVIPVRGGGYIIQNF